MHLTAAEAVGALNKTKWANTTADDRLRILEKIQAKMLEEMEDLGLEEAEMKNTKVATMDNLYAPDACRLTAVVPMAFAISSAIDLYKTNMAGKQLLPVRTEKVEQNGGVDMIDFGVPTPDASQTAEDEEESSTPAPTPAPTPSPTGGMFYPEPTPTPGPPPGPTPGPTPHPTPAPTPADIEEAQKENGGTNGDEEKETLKENGEEEPANNTPQEPSEAPPEPPSEAPPEPPTERPPEPPSESPPEPPSENPPEPPSENPPEPPSENPPEPPSDPPPVAPSEAPPEPPSDPPPMAPSDPPPEPPSDPPPPVPPASQAATENGDHDDDNKQTPEIEQRVSMDGTETSEVTEGQLNDVGLDDSEVPSNDDKEVSTNAHHDDKIKIEFDEDDEFANLDPDVDPNDLIFHDMLVSPRTWNEKGYFNSRQERLRVQGDPNHRVGPYDRRDPQATAILGASCYSSAAEVIKATFLDGHVVVYKPHPYNADVDKIWSEIMKPLVEVGAVTFCQADQGPELIQDERIDQVYMTGSEETGHEIRKLTQKPCVLQTGSVNPVILVPGLDRPWRPKEIRHHALQIATAGKFNGGHFCGRPQVIITSKDWDQRDEFMEELEKAIAERIPPEGSYDPKYRVKFERFVQEYPDAKIIEAEGLDTDSARVLLVKGAAHDSYGLQHEAFCQVLIEVALDLPDHPVAFLPDAVKFCNEKLYGSLCATIVIDDATNKKYTGIVHQALTDLRYGTVATNAIALFGWFNPSLYWGGYRIDKEDPKAKGIGHFGNLMGYENAIKSVITDNFCGQGHFIKTSRGAYAQKIVSLSYYALEPTMKKVTAYKYKGVRAAAASRDW